jgi:hypothetical protein
MMRFLNSMSLAYPLLGLAHDFILTPFSVLENTESVTVTFSTPASFEYVPKLPMLHM